MTAPKILVIDDDKQVTDLLSDFLGGLGYEIAVAGDGYAAIPAFQKLRPDLVITDFRMPAGDGSMVLAKLRALSSGQSVPVIVLTAQPEAARAAIVASAAVRVMAKPIRLEEIAQEVAALVGRPRAPRRSAIDPDDDEPPPSSGIMLDLDS